MLDALAPVLIPLAFVVATVALALGTYTVTRALATRLVSDKTQELAGSVMFRIAALHALILGLVFAQETANYRELNADLVREATAVTDIFYDLDRHGTADSAQARASVAAYAEGVVMLDWPLLRSEGRLASETYVLWDEIYRHVLDLPATTAREEALRDHMLENIHQIAALRQARRNAAQLEIPWLFWLAAVVGVIFVAMPYFTFPPTVLHLALLSVFGTYTGLVLAIIYAFADPFEPPGHFAPSAYEDVLRGEIGSYRPAS